MMKTKARLNELASALRDLRNYGLTNITAGDPLTTYIGAASQHALRMSFVTLEEAQEFDNDVINIWSEMSHTIAGTPSFYSYPCGMVEQA